MAEWPKALAYGSIQFGGVGSNPTTVTFWSYVFPISQHIYFVKNYNSITLVTLVMHRNFASITDVYSVTDVPTSKNPKSGDSQPCPTFPREKWT